MTCLSDASESEIIKAFDFYYVDRQIGKAIYWCVQKIRMLEKIVDEQKELITKQQNLILKHENFFDSNTPR